MTESRPRAKRYTPKLIAEIMAALEESGSDRVAYSSVRLSKDSYYQWQKDYPEFADQVRRAKQRYRDRLVVSDRSLIDMAHKQIVRMLQDGASETWESETTHLDLNGETETPRRKEKTQKRVRRDTPSWVLDRVMGPARESIDLLVHLLLTGAIADDQRLAVARFLRRAAPLLDDQTKEAIESILSEGDETEP
jgi:hypothetical protein